MAESRGKAHLQWLPVELTQSILSALPDVSSLRSAILSCRYLYTVFCNDKENILPQVLIRGLDPDVRYALVQAIKSETLGRDYPAVENMAEDQRDKWLDFLAAFFEDAVHPPPLLDWSPASLKPLVELYEHVQFFARDFAARALWRSPKPVMMRRWRDRDSTLPRNRLAKPFSRGEMRRLELAFLRFEIYSNLFRNTEWMDRWICVAEDWFWKFSYWENEQLACVHDYLAEEVKPILHEQYDNVEWLQFLHEQYGCGNNDKYAIQHQLSRGLAYLRGLIQTWTSEERQVHLEDEESLVATFDFLGTRLHSASSGDDRVLADIQPEEEKDYISPPLFQDVDSGPEDAWRWAHAAESPGDWVYARRQSPLREWGYVMWDRERLDAWGVFKHAWCPKDLGPYGDRELDRIRTERESEAIEAMLIDLDVLDGWG